jgi:nuclear cap-binding protein subunit 2
MLSFSLQVRDEYRTDFDEGRGGYGKIVSNKIRPRDSL